MQDQVKLGDRLLHRHCLHCCYCDSPYEKGFQRTPADVYACSKCYKSYTCPICKNIVDKQQKTRNHGSSFYHDYCFREYVSADAHWTPWCNLLLWLPAATAYTAITELTMTMAIAVVNISLRWQWLFLELYCFWTSVYRAGTSLLDCSKLLLYKYCVVSSHTQLFVDDDLSWK